MSTAFFPLTRFPEYLVLLIVMVFALPTRTNEEKMISHVIIGDRMIHDVINEKFQDFPVEIKNQLSHLILSHHGKSEWGSPIPPETPEAIALHYADILDSQVKNSLQRKL